MTTPIVKWPDGKRATPIVKWPGGKRALADRVLAAFGPIDGRGLYLEPFAGGAAVFFALRDAHPTLRCGLSDANAELIHLYRVVREDVDGLIRELGRAHYRYDESRYYEIRAAIPDDPIARAARTIYLNRCGFNGVYRVNNNGQFNVPFGRHTNPTICDADGLRAAAAALTGVTLLVSSFEDAMLPPSDLSRAQCREWCDGLLVYCDPPYLPIAHGSFTRYADPFGEIEHRALAAAALQLVMYGARVVLSNADTPLAHELYPDQWFERRAIQVARSVSRTGDRSKAAELLIVGRP